LDRAHGHEALPDRNVVTLLDAAPCYEAVDRGPDIAIAQIQVRLSQVGFGLIYLGLGQFDGRRLAENFLVDALDVAFLVALEEVRQDLVRQIVIRLWADAERGGALKQLCQRLANT